MASFEEFLRWEEQSRDVIKVQRMYIDIAEDIIAGLLLSQIVYWYLPSKQDGKPKLRVKKDGEYWLAKNRNDWWDECRIKPRQFDNAFKKLEEKGLVEKRLYRFNGSPTIHIRLMPEVLLKCINSILQKSEIDGNSQNEPHGSNQRCNFHLTESDKSLTETTTETTTKTTEKQTNIYSESAVAESRTADYKSFPTEEYISLGQYLESQGGTNYFDPNSIEATKYYINSYRRLFNIDHPRYTKEKWSDIIDSVLLIPKVDRDSGEIYISEDPYDYFEIIERIDTYFRQRFRESCNFAILHFLEPEVKWRIEQKARCGEEN
jgi:hypothetical protein